MQGIPTDRSVGETEGSRRVQRELRGYQNRPFDTDGLVDDSEAPCV